MQDLTERRVAEESNQKSAEAVEATEETFDLMVNAVKDYAIFILSPTGIIAHLE